VFNLFVISIFWSFNSDFFNASQAKRLYGTIAAGGSAGAVVGPMIATILVGKIGVTSLLLISLGFMILATFFVFQMAKIGVLNGKGDMVLSMKGSIWDGLRLIAKSPMLKQISLFILLYSTISTFLYFEQAHIVSNAFTSSADRASYFGTRDLLVSIVTLSLQFFLTEKIIRKWGVVFCLILVPTVSILAFFSLSISQSVYLLLGIQIVYGSLNLSIQRPTREVLFTSVSVEEKYRSKNFIDTAVYRGGDAVGGWLFTGISYLMGSLQAITLAAIPLALAWMAVGLKTGKLFNRTTSNSYETSIEVIAAKKSA
ncbi:MAG: Npt1/Npt2 family nucleotide transporter, partial [Cyclobacteriaceae bacterium]